MKDDEDPRGRPLSLSEALPPANWKLALFASVCCGGAAVWIWVSGGSSWLRIIAALTSVAWLVFAAMKIAAEQGGN